MTSVRGGVPSQDRLIFIEARVLATLWDRNRMVCSLSDPSLFHSLFCWLRIYIPRYRQLLVLGDVPKETRHLKGVRVLDGGDLPSRMAALEQAFSDEETGAPPVQVVGFGLEAESFRMLHRRLDRGWIAFFPGLTKKTLEDEGLPVHEEIALEGGSLFLLDPPPADLSPEEELLLETASCSPAMKDFMIQMRQIQMNLAFQAIHTEIEADRPVTRPYLSETLRIKEKGLKKILHLGQREQRLNLESYIKDTPPQIIEFLKSLSRESDLALAALFDREELIGYARYRECFFPSRNILNFKRILDRMGNSACDPGRPWFMEIRAGDKTVHIYQGRFLYGFLLEGGAKNSSFRNRVRERILALERKPSGRRGAVGLTGSE
ncbi:MAG: hypothetical protein JW747_08590 [Candidatus Aminicenantes bacterium]|nr:hypothetical protein [Candidatus Aminicenantes bacterium]